MHLVKNKQNVRVLFHCQKRRQAWDIWRGSAKMHLRSGRSTRDMFIRDVRRSGRWYPARGCILEHQIFRFAKMILRDRCSTSYELASLFSGRRSTLDRWNGKTQNALARSRQLCIQLSVFEGSLAELLRYWCCQLDKLRTSRTIAAFLMLSSSKIEEVWQNCCVFKLAGCRQADRQTDGRTER